ncbi:protein phosphatase [Sphingorhabdus lutea]|uniref:Protein phosphatase n=1 Tax=Sphingorhabdus lutea TaxID=1913578 RepID=A0A1L3J8V9_9SPHN|nr:bifunctional protein-serine/threonine kinase/phosphatase [Sphingorhabdus lutea]APG61572.1 protein phosphatase [Sphingorhabdus lutea]
MQKGELQLAIGCASEQGRRADNQDFAGCYLGSPRERISHGMIAALADGVGGAKAGRMAAELCARSLIDGFYSQPETIGVAMAAQNILAPYNRWLHSMGKTPEMAHAATTFTSFILKGRKAHALHVGDSRAWHFRGGNLVQLTHDHCLPHPDQQHILFRAIGIEERLRLDHHDIALMEHDRLLLTSDGVHGALTDKQISKYLASRGAAQNDAEKLVEAAIEAGSQDNCSAIIIDIIALPNVNHDSIAGDIAKLPILPPPNEGESVDGFLLEKMLSDGRYTRLFRATDNQNGQEIVLKFPKPALLSEHGARISFAREILVASHVNSPFVGGAIMLDPHRQSRLYGAQPFYDGMTLEERLKRPISLENSLDIAIKLTRAVAALHRLDIIHRDIKPENVILTQDGGLKLIDLGVARLPKMEEFIGNEIPGTPTYLAPEMYAGNAGDAATDQFALGVTLWQLFVGREPFGKKEAFSRPQFVKPEPASRYRPDVPAWLDAALMQSIAISPKDRFDDIVDLLRALEGGAAVARIRLEPVPLIERNPILLWQILCLMLFIALICSLILR